MKSWSDIEHFRQRQITVLQPCTQDRVPEADAGEFINIEEGPQGEDVLTYMCAACGEAHRSRRFG